MIIQSYINYLYKLFHWLYYKTVVEKATLNRHKKWTDGTESLSLGSENGDSTFDLGYPKNDVPVLMCMLGRTPVYTYPCIFSFNSTKYWENFIPKLMEPSLFLIITSLFLLKTVFFPLLTQNKNWADLNQNKVKLKCSWNVESLIHHYKILILKKF